MVVQQICNLPMAVQVRLRAYQEKYNIKEIEIDEIFRNKDKSKWKN